MYVPVLPASVSDSISNDTPAARPGYVTMPLIMACDRSMIIACRLAPPDLVERAGEGLGDPGELRLGDHEGRRDLQRDTAEQPGDDAAVPDGGDQSLPDRRAGGPEVLGDLDGSEQSGPRPDRADAGMLAERRNRRGEHRLERGDALDQLLPLDEVEVRQRHGSGSRMPGVRVAMPEHRRRSRLPERLGHPGPDDDGPDRQVAGAEALGAGDHVRIKTEPLAGEPGADPSVARDDLIGHEQHVVAPADLAHRPQVALRRRVDAASADHGLAEERGDPVLPEHLDGLLQRRRV